MSLHAVPFDVFQEKIQSVRTYHDVLRIFYGNHVLTNDIIDSVMENNAEPYNTPYGTMVGFSPVRRPRIGDRDSDYYSTVFHTRYVGEGTDKHHVLVHDSHYSPSSSSVMSTSKGSAASDIMLSDGAAAAPARRADHKTRTASAAHHHKSRRRRRKSKGRGRKRKKGKGRKRYKKGKTGLIRSIAAAFCSYFVHFLLFSGTVFSPVLWLWFAQLPFVCFIGLFAVQRHFHCLFEKKSAF